MIHWWKQRHAYGHGGCDEGERAEGGDERGFWSHGHHAGHGHHGRGPGPGRGFGGDERGGWWAGHGHGGGGPGDDGGGFGVRRPLRFLAYKLELDENQVEKLARVLDELKIERAQGAVDQRRSSGALADAVEGETLDAAGLAAAAADRAKSAERLAQAVAKALTKIHELLTPKQRTQLAYLIRTGTLSI
jgi:Spy/CpxP family protein refolding chaperone